MTAREIKKEQLSELVFPESDVLITLSEKTSRKEKLLQVMQLSNLDKQKAKIIFKDKVGLNFVYTTVWFVSDMHVQFKSGILMPISAILEVIL